MTAELYAFTCGHITLPKLVFLDGAEGELRVPVPVFLVKHAKGMVLFDSGLNPALTGDADAYLGDAAAYTRVEFEAGETVSGRLAAAGFDAGRVTHLVNSHLHYDHAGGNCDCPNADVLVQRAEWDFAEADQGATPGYVPRDWQTGQRVRRLDGESDLFGDGSVVCIPTPGHTPGHQSLRVRTDRGEALLCGDACYLRETLERLALPGFPFDRDESLATLKRLRAFQAEGLRLFFGHDPEFWAGVPQGPERVL